MRKIIAISLLCCCILVSLTGCFDANEVDDMCYVLALGIDRGTTDTWRLTIEYPSLQGSGSEAGGSGKGGSGSSSSTGNAGYETITIDVPGFFTGINMINTSIPRRLNFMNTKYIVFSEDLARSGDIGEFLAPLLRFRQVRRTTHVIVSKNSAMDFIKANKPYIGTTLSKTMETLITEADNTGFFPHITLNELNDDIKSTYHQSAITLGAVNSFDNLKLDEKNNRSISKQEGDYYAGQLPRQGGNSIELFGCAVFDGDTMVGELNGEESRFMMIARGDFKRGFFSMKDPKNQKYIIPFNVRMNKKPEVNIKISGEKSVINLKIELEGDILAIQSHINYENPDLLPELEKQFTYQIKTGIDNTINKCKALKADVFNFGDIASMQFGTIQNWEEFNWNKKFENAEVTSEVSFKIKRTGTMLKSAPITSTEEKR